MRARTIRDFVNANLASWVFHAFPLADIQNLRSRIDVIGSIVISESGAPVRRSNKAKSEVDSPGEPRFRGRGFYSHQRAVRNKVFFVPFILFTHRDWFFASCFLNCARFHHYKYFAGMMNR